MKAKAFYQETLLTSVPILSVLSAFLLLIVFMNSLSINTIPYVDSYNAIIPKLTQSITSTANALNAQVKWGIAAFLFSAAVAVSVILSAVIINRFGTISHFYWISAIAAAACLTIYFLSLTHSSFEPKFTVDLFKSAYQCSGIDCNAMSVALARLDAIVAIPIVFLTSSASYLLVRLAKNDGPQLAERMQFLTYILYIGSAILLLGVNEMNTLYRWPVELLTGVTDTKAQEMVKALTSMAETLSFATGAVFSVILIAIFLPAAFAIMQYSRSKAVESITADQQPVSKTAIDQKLTAFGFPASPMETVLKVMATIGPMVLGSSVNSIIGVLKQIGS